MKSGRTELNQVESDALTVGKGDRFDKQMTNRIRGRVAGRIATTL